MKTRTVIISLGFHAAIAATLLGAAGKKALRKPTAVAFTEEKKKAKAAPPKPPPAPPRPVIHPVEHKVASVSKALPEPMARAAPAPVMTALTMSNDDGPGGIALPSRGPAAKAAPAAAGAKVASAVTDARKQRLREAATGGEDAPCNEEATKPEPVFKQEIEYTAAARAEGVEGRLKLRLTIAADGSVTKVDVLESVAPELDAAAVAAAKQWRFKPASACGKSVAGGTYVLVRRFELGD
ncbi:MAG TPA: TonB family protein [Polyangia bacterium]|jgi:protein TonB